MVLCERKLLISSTLKKLVLLVSDSDISKPTSLCHYSIANCYILSKHKITTLVCNLGPELIINTLSLFIY